MEVLRLCRSLSLRAPDAWVRVLSDASNASMAVEICPKAADFTHFPLSVFSRPLLVFRCAGSSLFPSKVFVVTLFPRMSTKLVELTHSDDPEVVEQQMCGLIEEHLGLPVLSASVKHTAKTNEIKTEGHEEPQEGLDQVADVDEDLAGDHDEISASNPCDAAYFDEVSPYDCSGNEGGALRNDENEGRTSNEDVGENHRAKECDVAIKEDEDDNADDALTERLSSATTSIATSTGACTASPTKNEDGLEEASKKNALSRIKGMKCRQSESNLPKVTCHLCGKLYSASSIRQHVDYTHLKKLGKKYFCKICGKAFRNNYTLNIHFTRAHTDEKPFCCSICGKTFSTRARVMLCQRNCRGEYLHRCPYCQRGFNVSTHLTKHLRTHTGERPFSCPVCGFSCAQFGNLRVHMKGKHKMESEQITHMLAQAKKEKLAKKEEEERDQLTNDIQSGVDNNTETIVLEQVIGL